MADKLKTLRGEQDRKNLVAAQRIIRGSITRGAKRGFSLDCKTFHDLSEKFGATHPGLGKTTVQMILKMTRENGSTKAASKGSRGLQSFR
jgi:hypothetical protein